MLFVFLHVLIYVFINCCTVPVPELEKHGHHIWKYIRLSIDHLACTFDEPFYSTWNLDFMEFNQSLQI